MSPNDPIATTGSINIDGDVFENVEIGPSERLPAGSACASSTGRTRSRTTLPPERIRWVQEGSAHGPLR